MTKAKSDFTISTVCEYDVAIQTITAIIQLGAKYKFRWNIGAVSGYNRAKNSKWTQFLFEDDAPYLINIDRDMVFTTQDVDYLMEDLESGYDLVGAAYAAHNATILTAWGNNGEGIELNGEVYEVKFLSQGFCGISRRVLEKIVDELHLPLLNSESKLEQYPFCMDGIYNESAYGHIYLSEDYNFCELCKKVGVVPMLDTRLHVGHVAKMTWYPEHVAIIQGNVTKLNEVRRCV